MCEPYVNVWSFHRQRCITNKLLSNKTYCVNFNNIKKKIASIYWSRNLVLLCSLILYEAFVQRKCWICNLSTFPARYLLWSWYFSHKLLFEFAKPTKPLYMRDTNLLLTYIVLNYDAHLFVYLSTQQEMYTKIIFSNQSRSTRFWNYWTNVELISIGGKI